jgi:hypothetical protein
MSHTAHVEDVLKREECCPMRKGRESYQPAINLKNKALSFGTGLA